MVVAAAIEVCGKRSVAHAKEEIRPLLIDDTMEDDCVMDGSSFFMLNLVMVEVEKEEEGEMGEANDAPVLCVCELNRY